MCHAAWYNGCVVKFIASYRQFRVSLEVPEGQPVDTPENRERLLTKLGRMLVEKLKDQVRFSSDQSQSV